MNETLAMNLCSILTLAACGEDSGAPASTGSLGLTISSDQVRLARTKSFEVPIAITRDQIDGDVMVEVTGLPADVTAEPLTIAPGETVGKLIITAGATAPLLMPSEVTLTATSEDASADESFGLVVTGIPGQLDETYGVGGVRLSGIAASDFGTAAALQSDGKLVIAWFDDTAALHVRRYDASGQLDTTFSGDGDVQVDSGAQGSLGSGQNIAIRSDGTIQVAYLKGVNAQVVGLTSNGDLAPGFGEGGSKLTLTNVELGGAAASVTLTRDHAGADYVVVAVAETAKIYRLTSGGLPDPAFGAGGVLTTYALRGYASAIDAQARIVVAGSLSDNRTIGRIAADGMLDATFSGDGKNTISGGGIAWFLQATVLDDDRIAAIGDTGNPVVHVFGDDGELDTSFSGDGQLMITGNSSRVLQERDALIMASGTDGSSFNVHRISLTDGTLVTSFDGDGIAVVPLGGGYSTDVRQAILDAEGRLVIFGHRATPDGYDFAIARMWL